jgi:hypothetical protein
MQLSLYILFLSFFGSCLVRNTFLIWAFVKHQVEHQTKIFCNLHDLYPLPFRSLASNLLLSHHLSTIWYFHRGTRRNKCRGNGNLSSKWRCPRWRRYWHWLFCQSFGKLSSAWSVCLVRWSSWAWYVHSHVRTQSRTSALQQSIRCGLQLWPNIRAWW